MSSKKRGLGRGLDALIDSESSAPVRTLQLEQMRPNRRQPRAHFDEAGLDELAESIRAQGVVQPLVVSPDGQGGYTIVAGERRWRAAQRAGLETVPVVIREVEGERQLLELALVENLQRTDLNPVEEAEAYRALSEDFGLTQDQVASRVGKGRPTVANALRLLRLASPVLELLRAGQLTAGQARPLLALEDEAAQEALARRAVAQGLSARRLEELAQRGKPHPRRPQPTEVHAAAAAEKLTQRLQTKVEIQRRRRGGVLRIHFHSEDELMRLYELLMQKGGRA